MSFSKNIFTPIYSVHSGSSRLPKGHCGTSSSVSSVTRLLTLNTPTPYYNCEPKYSFFRKVYSFKIFRFTTKLKKYSKFLTIFPKQFYMRRKRRTSNYSFVILFSYWVRAFMLEKQNSKFFQNLGLYRFTVSLPNSVFTLRQVKKANLEITLNLYRAPSRSRYPVSGSTDAKYCQFTAGFSSRVTAVLLNSNQIWINKRVILDSYSVHPLFSSDLAVLSLYTNILDLLYLHLIRSGIYRLYRISTLLSLFTLYR